MKIKEISVFPDVLLTDEVVKQRYENNKDSLKYLFHLNSFEVEGTNWPLKENKPNRFYFLAGGEPVGYILLSSNFGEFTTKMVFMNKKFRNTGVVSAFYRKILDSGKILISDGDQTKGSQRIWKGLMKTHNLYLIEMEWDGYDIIKKVSTDNDFFLAYRKNEYRLLVTKKPLKDI